MARILIIDDDAVTRTALKDIVNTESPQVIDEAADGQAALDLLCDGLRPDLCILDLQMPNMGGLELLQRIRRDPKLGYLKVVVSSSNRDREVILALSKLSISGYILKPFDPTRTLSAIKQAIGTILAGHPDEKHQAAKNILLIDDDDVSRHALRDIIRQSVHAEIVEVKDGQEALNRLHNGHHPDLVVADLQMPTLDGIQLLQRIRGDAKLRSLRYVVASATQDREKIRVLAQLQISGYLLKPFDSIKVKASIRQALGLPAEAPPAATHA